MDAVENKINVIELGISIMYLDSMLYEIEKNN